MENGNSIQKQLVTALKEKNLTVATAESLTGGMVSEIITSVSGASSVIECGVCSYSNRIKHEVLGVSEQTLGNYTEYSIQTAEEMAYGVRKLSGASIGISTTGIAGPSGFTPDKPVGFVCIGVSSSFGTVGRKFLFGEQGMSDRETIRRITAETALKIALEEVMKH